jgi:hypothetical protein
MSKVTIIHKRTAYICFKYTYIEICGVNLTYALAMQLHVELFQIVRKTMPEKDVLLKADINLRLIQGPQIL